MPGRVFDCYTAIHSAHQRPHSMSSNVNPVSLSYLIAALAATSACSTEPEPCVANDDYTTVASSGQVSLDILENDHARDADLDPRSISIVKPPDYGQLEAHRDGTFTYIHDGSGSAYDRFVYTVSDTRGEVSNRATVTIALPGEKTMSPQDCANHTPISDMDKCVIKFFDGNSLTGVYSWIQGSGFDDPQNIFSVQDGLLHVSGDGLGALISDQEFRNFRMVLEFKWGEHTYGERAGKAKDAGIFVHSYGIEGGVNGKWMPGIQSQIMDGSMGDLIVMRGKNEEGVRVPISITINTEQVVCGFESWNCRNGYRWNPGGSRLIFNEHLDHIHWYGWDPNWQDMPGYRGTEDVESPDREWNTMVVIADDDSLEIFLNGVKVNEASNVYPAFGKVQLEVEWAEYFVRRWELWPLSGAISPYAAH